MDKIRSFIAIGINETLKSRFGELQNALSNDGIDSKWVGFEGFHLTLKFLGEVEKKILADIEVMLRKLYQEQIPLTLHFKDVGSFQMRGSSGVIWVGIEEDRSLKELHEKTEDAMHVLGFRKEKRRFTPHLTLGRSRNIRNISQFKKIIEKYRGTDFGFLKVDSIVLMKSELRPDGARYSKIAEFPLSA